MSHSCVCLLASFVKNGPAEAHPGRRARAGEGLGRDVRYPENRLSGYFKSVLIESLMAPEAAYIFLLFYCIFVGEISCWFCIWELGLTSTIWNCLSLSPLLD